MTLAHAYSIAPPGSIAPPPKTWQSAEQPPTAVWKNDPVDCCLSWCHHAHNPNASTQCHQSHTPHVSSTQVSSCKCTTACTTCSSRTQQDTQQQSPVHALFQIPRHPPCNLQLWTSPKYPYSQVCPWPPTHPVQTPYPQQFVSAFLRFAKNNYWPP